MTGTPTPSQFTGVPFVMGSIYGERCFDVRDDGTLLSPQKSHVWLPGENVSACQVYYRFPPSTHSVTTMKRALESVWPDRDVIDISGNAGNPKTVRVHWRSKYKKRVVVWDPAFESTEAEDKIEACLGEVEIYPEGLEEVSTEQIISLIESLDYAHDFAKCQCGFYAYLTGAGHYYKPERVMAVIEGYGETLVGTKGFRSSKARILAVAPCPSQPTVESDNWTNTGTTSGGFTRMSRLYAVGGGGGGGGVSDHKRLEVLMSSRTQAAAAALTQVGQQASVTANRFAAVSEVVEKKEKKKKPKNRWKSIHKQYPDVIVFKSAEEMFEQFPITPLEDIA